MADLKMAYWPGCVSRGFTTELHGSMGLVAERLGIELVELDRANCCGAGVIAEHNQELADTLNARTFALAQQTGLPMMNICSTCQGAQSECQQRLRDSEYRSHINETLAEEGLSYDPEGFSNKNFLWVLVEDYGLDRLKEQVQRPLGGLKVGPFYGCYILRPKHRLGYEEHPERDLYLGPPDRDARRARSSSTTAPASAAASRSSPWPARSRCGRPAPTSATHSTPARIAW